MMHVHRQTDLAQIVATLRLARCLTGRMNGWQ
jgi:hypothetical protein